MGWACEQGRDQDSCCSRTPASGRNGVCTPDGGTLKCRNASCSWSDTLIAVPYASGRCHVLPGPRSMCTGTCTCTFCTGSSSWQVSLPATRLCDRSGRAAARAQGGHAGPEARAANKQPVLQPRRCWTSRPAADCAPGCRLIDASGASHRYRKSCRAHLSELRIAIAIARDSTALN